MDLLSSLLDDAPVTTIDAFLNRLVAPYIDELMPRRVDGHVPEEGMETLHDTAIAPCGDSGIQRTPPLFKSQTGAR